MPRTHFASPSLSSPLCQWHALHWYTYSHYIRFTSCAIFILKTRTELDSRWCSFSCWLYRNQRLFFFSQETQIFCQGLGGFSLALRPQKPEIFYFFCQGLGRFQFSFMSTETRDFLSGTGSFSVQLYVHRNQRFFVRDWVIFSLALRPQKPEFFCQGLGGFSLALRPQKPEIFCQGLGRFQFSFTSTETRRIFVRDWVVFSLALLPQKPDGFR